MSKHHHSNEPSSESLWTHRQTHTYSLLFRLMCICVCTYMGAHVCMHEHTHWERATERHTQTQRERERERERENKHIPVRFTFGCNIIARLGGSNFSFNIAIASCLIWLMFKPFSFPCFWRTSWTALITSGLKRKLLTLKLTEMTKTIIGNINIMKSDSMVYNIPWNC